MTTHLQAVRPLIVVAGASWGLRLAVHSPLLVTDVGDSPIRSPIEPLGRKPRRPREGFARRFASQPAKRQSAQADWSLPVTRGRIVEAYSLSGLLAESSDSCGAD